MVACSGWVGGGVDGWMDGCVGGWANAGWWAELGGCVDKCGWMGVGGDGGVGAGRLGCLVAVGQRLATLGITEVAGRSAGQRG